MDTVNLQNNKVKRRMPLDEYVQRFIDKHKINMENRDGFLSFIIYDKFFDIRKQKLFGSEEYPYAHCKLKVPNKELAEIIADRFNINYYELSLHKNRRTKMHNAYCSLMENSYLVKYFSSSDKTTVMFEEEPDLEKALQKADIILSRAEVLITDNTYHNNGKFWKKNNRNNLVPLRCLVAPSKQFFNWLYSIEGLEIVENNSGDFYYYLCDADNPRKTLRRFTTELVLSIQAGCDKRI